MLAIVMALLYGAAAVVQYNDPDPLRWMILYGTAAILSLASAFRPLPRPSLYLVAAIAAVWAATLVPEIIEVGAYTGIEIEREFGGLVLVALGLVWLACCSCRAAPPPSAA